MPTIHELAQFVSTNDTYSAEAAEVLSQLVILVYIERFKKFHEGIAPTGKHIMIESYARAAKSYPSVYTTIRKEVLDNYKELL
jgi:hypothetical protein